MTDNESAPPSTAATTAPATAGAAGGRLAAYRADLACLAFLLLFSLALLWPLVLSGAGWGSYDWDQHLFYYEAARRSVAEHGQFPLWNPWYCGGNPAFANPQSPVLSLSFLLSLMFGAVVGLKVSAVMHAFLGMVGGWLLARAHGIDRVCALFGAMVMMGSTAFTLHVAVGHTIWFATAYIPWALWCYVRSRGDMRWSIGAGIALLAMTLHGQLYFVLYTLLALALWALADTVAGRSPRPLIAVASAGCTFGLLGAVKLLPMQELFAAQDFQLVDRSSSPWRLLAAALLSRDQALTRLDGIDGLPWGWWEYGAYIGLLPLLLAGLGARGTRGGTRTLAALAIVFLWLCAGWDAGLWPLLQRLPLGAGLRVPSRLILIAVLFFGLLAACGLHAVRARLVAAGRPHLAFVVPTAVVLLLALDLGAVSRNPLALSFAVIEPAVAPPGAFVQVLGARRYQNRTPYATMYPYLLENRGVVNCFERFRLPVRARPLSDADGQPLPGYRGEAYLIDGGAVHIALFSANAIEVDYDTPYGGVLVLNQNFDRGWHAGDVLAIDHGGLVATVVAPGRGRMRFWYRPRSVLIGAAISVCSAIGLVFIARSRDARRSWHTDNRKPSAGT